MFYYAPAHPPRDHPTPPDRPPRRRVPPHAPPAQDPVRAEGRVVARRQGGEEEEARRAEVVEELEGEDLREDLERGGVPWGTMAGGHFLNVFVSVCIGLGAIVVASLYLLFVKEQMVVWW